MSQETQNIQQSLQEELSKYEKSPQDYKSYMDLMDEISVWLKELQK